MATIKPRLQILLNPDTKAVVELAASQMGISASRLVSDFLDAALPAIRGLGESIEEVKRDQVKGLSAYKNLIVDARQKASDAQVDLEEMISATKPRQSHVEPRSKKDSPKPKPKAKTKPKA